MAALDAASKIDEEVEEIKKDIVRLGSGNATGQYVVKFGKLFVDEKVGALGVRVDCNLFNFCWDLRGGGLITQSLA